MTKMSVLLLVSAALVLAALLRLVALHRFLATSVGGGGRLITFVVDGMYTARACTCVALESEETARILARDLMLLACVLGVSRRQLAMTAIANNDSNSSSSSSKQAAIANSNNLSDSPQPVYSYTVGLRHRQKIKMPKKNYPLFPVCASLALKQRPNVTMVSPKSTPVPLCLSACRPSLSTAYLLLNCGSFEQRSTG